MRTRLSFPSQSLTTAKGRQAGRQAVLTFCNFSYVCTCTSRRKIIFLHPTHFALLWLYTEWELAEEVVSVSPTSCKELSPYPQYRKWSTICSSEGNWKIHEKLLPTRTIKPLNHYNMLALHPVSEKKNLWIKFKLMSKFIEPLAFHLVKTSVCTRPDTWFLAILFICLFFQSCIFMESADAFEKT